MERNLPEIVDIVRLWLPRTSSDGRNVGSSTTSSPESESKWSELSFRWWKWFWTPFIKLACKFALLLILLFIVLLLLLLDAFNGGGNGGGGGPENDECQNNELNLYSKWIFFNKL